MGDGREHQKYEDAPLFRCVITRTYDLAIEPRPRHYPVSGESVLVSIKGPYNTPGPARAARARAVGEAKKHPRRGETVSARVQIGVTNWGDLT